MVRGINKVILIGSVGQDPETKYMPSGGAVTNITVATSESWKDKQTGQQQERTEWHRVVFFNRLAEIVAEYIKKGSKVYVEGQLRTRNWEQDGVKRYTTEIVASEMQMLDSKQSSSSPAHNNGSSQSQNQNYAPQQQQQQQANRSPHANGTHQQQQQNRQAPPQSGEFDDDFDSDIPF